MDSQKKLIKKDMPETTVYQTKGKVESAWVSTVK